ncbi:hypothetical protein BN1080_02104 [Planococcus massiliensis]|uniref:AAA+ ATPase domain-containing protein n=1 Tax=Planococcus massiliensis TaxID=1499687 RepID=A0A098EMW5_9BACL|nr:AAA family ATPase [Planococcus massiliensis]CEG23160.1 hypothetical protein BN1080_02104 [Planococcus massiliensis]
MSFAPKKARREKQKAVIGFIGASGSGKTVSALLTAYGMMREAYPDASEEEVWEKIGVADTEHGRSLLYANEQFGEVKVGEFLHIDFDPPYSTERYNDAVQALKNAGCEVVIIDSLSHNWQGEGGIIETHAGMSGNSFQNWGKLSTETTSLIKTLTRNNVHILCTLRTKTEYVVEPNEQGKSAPRKIGTKPVQKDEMEYEFMINFVINAEHLAETTKDNTRLFEGNLVRLNEDVGSKLYKWLELGVDIKAEEAAEKAKEDEERAELAKEIRKLEQISEAHKAKVTEFEYKTKAKVEDFNLLLLERAKSLLETIEAPATEEQTN